MNRIVALRTAVTVAAIGLLSILIAACGSSSGAAQDTSAQQFGAAVQRYRAYLDTEATKLVSWVTRLTARVEAGQLNQAQSRYASSRVPFGHLEPFAVSLRKLDTRINAHPDEVPAGRLSGYHKIERGFWVAGTVDGMAPVSRQLLADTKTLRRKAKTADLRPTRIANGIDRTLAEVLTSEAVGKEEPYAHIDLVDIAANIEGVDAAFKALKPLLADGEHAALLNEIERRFHEVYVALGDFGVASWEQDQPRSSSPGTSFVLFIERSDAEHRRLGKHIEALAEPLSQLPAQVANR